MNDKIIELKEKLWDRKTGCYKNREGRQLDDHYFVLVGMEKAFDKAIDLINEMLD